MHGQFFRIINIFFTPPSPIHGHDRVHNNATRQAESIVKVGRQCAVIIAIKMTNFLLKIQASSGDYAVI